jgi:ceramide glucosyltransferase
MALAFAYTARLLELMAIVGCLQLALAAALVQYYVRRRKYPPPCPSLPPVSILVPLHGAEPGLFDRLAALCSQNYAAPVQLVLGTQTHIQVSETVQRLKRAFPNVPIEYIFDHREHGASRKFSNLINMMPFVRYDHLVLADSDVQVGPDYLVRLMAELQQPGVEVVTCLYRGRGTGNFWDRLAALSINADFLPKVVVSLTCHLAQPCLGPTIAIRRQMLNRIGGLSRVSNYLGADYLIGQAVRAAGGEVRFASFVIECACFEPNRAALFARQLRAARTIKTIKPWGYAGTIITHPLPLALLAALFNRPTGFLLAAAAISCRMLLYFSVERAFHLARQHYLLIVVHDLVAFAVFVASYFGQTVIWRGHKYHLTPSLRVAQINVDANSQVIEGADSAGH